jgi:PII-like signaling protein
MLAKGKARKLTIFINETDTRHGRPLSEVLVSLARKHGLGGATVTRALMGYGSSGVVHSARMVDLSPRLPLKVEIIDSPEAIDRILPDIYDIVAEGLVEVSDVEVVKFTPPARPKSAEVSHLKLAGKAKMVHIHIGANDRWEGEPLHEALVKRLHQMDIAGATVYRGLLGYGASGRVHRRKYFRSADEPLTIVVVDSVEKIEKAMPTFDQMVGGGMVIISDVDVVFYRESAQPQT